MKFSSLPNARLFLRIYPWRVEAKGRENKLRNVKGKTMPLIQVKVIEDVFSPAQKKEIIAKLTDAMVAIEGENLRSVTWVTIDEVRSGEWGIGGQALTTDAVRALAAGKK
jgi:4-oxalocrotonate tautomerase